MVAKCESQHVVMFLSLWSRLAGVQTILLDSKGCDWHTVAFAMRNRVGYAYKTTVARGSLISYA
jgi:hypothetical protein